MAKTYCDAILYRMERWLDSGYKGKAPVLMIWAGSSTLASMEYVKQAYTMVHRYVQHGPRSAGEVYESKKLNGQLRVVTELLEELHRA